MPTYAAAPARSASMDPPNANAGAHHYTVNEGEVAYLVSVGWSDEGVGFYSCK